ncbi:fumarylacetoacetate hydrolase family protein [Rhizobium sp. KVB221]|uniref:Fumarylacetoacetate hydrolase family protein n=1 Tax=Rhizobium setariae TaxID=2801340 RepID=A0A936YUU3_9HYPH|nr:fumarylacetoacetate hydrolase family protein [Rhizobium setariae]MBL0373452.1 fumarylacetoacetate hydrolase family protein [Rhizobium setariae]
MKLATLRIGGGTRAAILRDQAFYALDWPDVGGVLVSGVALLDLKPGPYVCSIADADYAPLVLRPPKIFCVGINYISHLQELAMEQPSHPTLFSKFHTSLAGANDDIALFGMSSAIDWEAELVAVIGKWTSKADRDQAATAIAGFCLGNDVSARDLQTRTPQWLAGKTLDASTPLGPWLVSTDEIGVRPDLELSCSVNGTIMQHGRTGDLLFDAADLVVDISAFCTLEPGDIIFTGTPGGIGAARQPKQFLKSGDILMTEIDGLGRCVNRLVA